MITIHGARARGVLPVSLARLGEKWDVAMPSPKYRTVLVGDWIRSAESG
jgi:hypothetical protein